MDVWRYFGDAFETLSNMIYEFAANMKASIIGVMQNAYNSVIGQIQSLLNGFKDTLIDALNPFSGSSSTAQAVKSAGAASSGSWWEWAKGLGGLGLVDIGDPHFQKWLSMHPEFRHLSSVSVRPCMTSPPKLLTINEEEMVHNNTNSTNQIALRF